MEWQQILIFVLTGAFAGTLAGLMGVGGGIIYVPVLVFFFEVQAFPEQKIPLIAVSTTLAIIFFSIFTSALTHYKKGSLQLHRLPYLAGGGVVGAIFGSLVIRWVSVDPFKLVLGLLQLYFGWKMVFGKKKEAHLILHPKGAMTKIGLLAGWISGFFGVGGGLMVVPLLHLSLGFTLVEAVGSATGYMIFSVGASLISYLVQSIRIVQQEGAVGGITGGLWGAFYLPAILAILPSSILFSWLGARLSHQVRERNLKKYFGVFVLGLGSFSLLRALYSWL